MIQSFADKRTALLFDDVSVPKFKNFERAARKKLTMLHVADRLLDLRTPPGNRLEALKGDRNGQHSIRINGQYRVCFRWVDGEGVFDVEICDYHK